MTSLCALRDGLACLLKMKIVRIRLADISSFSVGRKKIDRDFVLLSIPYLVPKMFRVVIFLFGLSPGQGLSIKTICLVIFRMQIFNRVDGLRKR